MLQLRTILIHDTRADYSSTPTFGCSRMKFSSTPTAALSNLSRFTMRVPEGSLASFSTMTRPPRRRSVSFNLNRNRTDHGRLFLT